MENKLIFEVDKKKIREKHLEGTLKDLQEELGPEYSRFLDVAEALAADLGLSIVIEAKVKIIS